MQDVKISLHFLSRHFQLAERINEQGYSGYSGLKDLILDILNILVNKFLGCDLGPRRDTRERSRHGGREF
jgi:hypothetical protein